MERGSPPVPVPRVVGKTPCHWCPKIPPGEEPHPNNAATLTDEDWQAYQHYLECKAVGQFPDDPLVRQTAAICRQVEESLDRMDRNRFGLTVLGGLMSLGGK